MLEESSGPSRGMKGMNVEQVENFEARFCPFPQEILDRFSELNEQIQELDWTGPDRERYVIRFGSQVTGMSHPPHLGISVSIMTEICDALGRNIRGQIMASGN